MKATGIVRRIDDLGRVVIPKEIRRTMRIREGDPLYTLLLHIFEFAKTLFCQYGIFLTLITEKQLPTQNAGSCFLTKI